MNILVFKTNIADAKHVKKVSPYIKEIDGIQKWNIDLHDVDKVLRVVVADDLAASYIEFVVQNAGYFCSELQD
ncbi:MAG: hypothetical protein H7178_11540 [Chitinophagaceae bacterium]|nr:hypothetical protein [Chitinophagaceae bacterium]